MPTGRVSKQSVDGFTPGATDRFLWDDRVSGFGLRVTPRGAKSYVFQYRMGGRETRARRLTIGAHGSPWTPDKARNRALDLFEQVRKGVDPLDAQRERRQQAVDLAFELYVELFNQQYLQKRWKDHKLGAGVLRREALPVLGRKALPNIRRSDLNAVFDRVSDRPAVARLLHATLRKLFRWAVGRGDIDRSPLEGAEAPPAVASRDRVLSDAELTLLWRTTDTFNPLFRGVYRLLIITGQRRDEVAGLDWREMDRSAALWTLAASRAKNGETHLVPLSPLAVSVLDELAGGDEWPMKGLVFSTTGKTAVSGFSKVKAAADATMSELAGGEAMDPWRLHDLRRTLATGLQRLGVRFEVTEAVLNHRSGSKAGIAGVYQRHDWKAEKRAALNAWAWHLICRLNS